MKKIILVVLIFFLFSSFVTKEVWAVTKTSGDLEVTFDEPIFSSSTVWYPGLIVGKSMTVKNKGSDSQTVSIEAVNKTQTGNFATVLFFKVLEWGIDRYGGSNNKTLQNFWDDGQVSLSSLAGGSTVVYDLTVTMDTAADNAYQGKEAKFDLQVGFVGTTSQVTVSGGDAGGGGGGGPAAPPVCNDTKPGSAPVLVSANTTGNNQVTLTWNKAADPVTYYLVAYGTLSGVYNFGNPNVGGKGTISYTVNNLNGGVMYYFVVRAGNGCMPGDFSNELAQTPLGGGAVGPAVGFLPGVLGAVTTPSPSPTIPSPAPTITSSTILGIQECKEQYYWWWLPLVVEAIVLVIYFIVIRGRNIEKWWMGPIIIGIIAQFTHRFWPCNCATGPFCPWYWLINIGIAALGLFLYYIFLKKSLTKRRN